jgi:hypothetical protein
VIAIIVVENELRKSQDSSMAPGRLQPPLAKGSAKGFKKAKIEKNLSSMVISIVREGVPIIIEKCSVKSMYLLQQYASSCKVVPDRVKFHIWS